MRSRHDNTPHQALGRTLGWPVRGAARGRIGMTLIEMLVAIGVLAVMILAVSQILVQTQRFISVAQASRRGHAMAFTIARIIRRDIRRASKEGFFGIDNNKLAFTTAGPVSGISEPIKGDGSIIVYGGQTCPSSDGGSGTATYLWRPEFVCYCNDGVPSTRIDGERINTDFSAIQRADANSSFMKQLETATMNARPTELALPPTKASHIKELWQVLVPDVDKVEIWWTDGTTRNGPFWHSEGGFWTHLNQENWPKAIRIKFTIDDPSMPAELRQRGYEVICNVGGQ